MYLEGKKYQPSAVKPLTPRLLRFAVVSLAEYSTLRINLFI